MDKEIDKGKKQIIFLKEDQEHLFNWIFLSIFAFLTVVLLYQVLVSTFSMIFGYDTHIHFVKVDSFPRSNQFWSGARVIVIYATPSVILLLLAALLIAVLYTHEDVNKWICYRFWIIVFAILFSTAQLSIAILFGILKVNNLQGYTILMNWYGLATPAAVVLLVLSIILNVGAGFLCSSLFMHLAPSYFYYKDKKRSPKVIVAYAFILPLIILFPISIIFSYPDFHMLFIVMFSLAFLWLPGLFIVSKEAILKRMSRRIIIPPISNYMLLGITIVILVLIRILL
jgi:hypothetical protein